MEFSKESWRVRFAAMDLSLRPGQERVFFTANNQKLAVALEQLCMRHVFQMPLPKYYGKASNMHSSSPGGPVIYAHMNARCGVMLEQIEPTIRAVLDRYPGARFLVKYCRNALQHGADATLSNGLIECGVELIPTEQSHAEHLHTIARSDVVFLPYEVTHYAGLASGVFAEGAALGKVLVYPGNSWMEQQVAGGHATGISFAVTNHSAISAAVLQALDMLPGLSKEAQERSHGFRAEHSCARNLTLMLSLADEKHDMRLTYTLGRPVAFKSPALSRGYMGRGWWSATEDDGVWSVGPFAELFFRIEPKPSGPLVARLRLTPYFAKEHPQRITISANGVEIGQWDFSDSEERQMTRLEFVIPSHLAAQDEINILFRIKNPISPHQIGASIDARALGIYLHEMIIEQATATNGESTTG